jgi:hypothetical protein
MRYRLSFAAGFAAGYFLGARAGRERYEQMVRALRGFAENPAVQETAGVLQAQAGEWLQSARRGVTAKVTERFGGHETRNGLPPYPAAAAHHGGNGQL